jgi:hypothetical protein
MSLESARLAYPLLVRVAREHVQAVRERRAIPWVTYEEFCQRCKDAGLEETPRTIVTRVLRPLQAACLEQGKPDLSSLIIQKSRGRTDSGALVRPSNGWWEPYEAKGETTTGDVDFWFVRYRQARDHAEWPEAPFF